VNVVTETIPDGDEGTAIVLERMRELVAARIAHPTVRGVAVDLARRVPAHNLRAQVAAVREFLARRVHFVADPDGPELLHDPVLLLEQVDRHGKLVGDCDDVALLGAALGGAIGLPARFVVVSFAGPAAPFEHVWTELYDGEAWRELDVTRPYQRAAEAPAIQRRTIIDITTGEATMSGAPNANGLVRIPDPYPPSRRRGRLGALPAVLVAAPKVIAWGSALFSAIAPFLGSSKDPERFKITDEAYNLAIAGNLLALAFLKQRTGDYGAVVIPGLESEGLIGGWGSAKAREYAKQKYAAALRATPPTTIPGEPDPIPAPGGGGPDFSPVPAGAGVMAASSKAVLAAIGIGLAFAVLKPRRSS